MSPEATLVFTILGVAGVLFATGWLRLDITAMLVVLSLMLSGILTPREALAGFGDPVVLLVAGLLVVGEMLSRTGVAYAVGVWLMRVGGAKESRLLVLMMAAAGALGSVMSSTAVVAVFIPVVLTIAAKTGLSASRLLMPLAFASLVSGMLTLIATTPNLVVSAELQQAGLEPFSFFSFTPIGVAVLGVATLYVWVLGRHLLPGEGTSHAEEGTRSADDLLAAFGVGDDFHHLRITPDSALAGRTLAETELETRFSVRVIGIERVGRAGRIGYLPSPGPDAEVRAGDGLIVFARSAALASLHNQLGLDPSARDERRVERWKEQLGLAVVLIHPESKMLGRSVRECALRTTAEVHVLALKRGDGIVAECTDEALRSGDSMLLLGRWDAIARLQGHSHDVVVLSLPREFDDIAPARNRAPIALAILASMVLLSAFEVVPVVAAVLMAALAAVLTGCISMDGSYRAVHWSSIVLIAGMLPLADAIQQTGGIDVVVDLLVYGLGEASPHKTATVLFFLTAGLGLVLSNTATAILIAPVAIRSAEILGVSPYPLAMTVAIAASAAFVTPVSTPVVTLVVAPGNYRFLDFVKVGIPLLLLTWITTLLVTPLFFPF